jgi:acetoin utilization protein AcuB
MLMPTIECFITRQPWTIRPDVHISVARRVMREHGIRHLPVLDDRKLVGLVSERDVLLLGKLLGDSNADATVEEAMTQDVYTVRVDTLADQVLEQMAERKVGSCVVTDKLDRVVGIFTTVDAMQCFSELLRRATA